MSDSDADDSNLPSATECERRCQEFATVTGTDTALAMFYLQDRDWDLDRALNSFFEEKAAEDTGSGDAKVVDLTGASNNDIKDEEPYRIRLISWNIDGLDIKNLRSRTLGVCETIKKEDPHVVFLQEVVPDSQDILEDQLPIYHFIPGEDPHVVFLQEVVPDSQDILEDQLPMYHFIPGNSEGYYTMMMVKTGHVQVEETKIYDYPTTMMMRNLLSVKCKIKGEKFYIMTSHLESTKEHAKERKNQLKKAFSLFDKLDNDRTIVFGGDLNLRDNEVTEIGGTPENVFDIWEVTGKRQHAKFTWDTQRNDNLEWGAKFKPKCRFDRLYVKYSRPQTVKPEYFELMGLERLKSCQRFCSDHWGLLTHLNILSKVPK